MGLCQQLICRAACGLRERAGLSTRHTRGPALCRNRCSAFPGALEARGSGTTQSTHRPPAAEPTRRTARQPPGPREAESVPGGPVCAGRAGRHLPSGVQHCCSQDRPNTWSTRSPWRTTSRLLLTTAACDSGKSVGVSGRRGGPTGHRTATSEPSGSSSQSPRPWGRSCFPAFRCGRHCDQGGLGREVESLTFFLLLGHENITQETKETGVREAEQDRPPLPSARSRSCPSPCRLL